jgi:methyl acetate hydrolase
MTDTNAIDGLLEGAVGEGALPGVVAVAGDCDGVLYEGAFGGLSVDGDEPARTDTMMRIASMTKAITSVAALQLIGYWPTLTRASPCTLRVNRPGTHAAEAASRR